MLDFILFWDAGPRQRVAIVIEVDTSTTYNG